MRKTDNNAMNGGFLRRFAVPNKSLMSKIYKNFMFEQIIPERRDGDSLRNRICGNKSARNIFVLNKIGGFFIPASNIIEISEIFHAVENFFHIGFLRGSLKRFSDKRWL